MNNSSSNKKRRTQPVDGNSSVRLGVQSRELDPVSVEEARRIMGKGAKTLSDEEIQNMIYDLTFIARDFIRAVPKE